MDRPATDKSKDRRFQGLHEAPSSIATSISSSIAQSDEKCGASRRAARERERGWPSWAGLAGGRAHWPARREEEEEWRVLHNISLIECIHLRKGTAVLRPAVVMRVCKGLFLVHVTLIFFIILEYQIKFIYNFFDS